MTIAEANASAGDIESLIRKAIGGCDHSWNALVTEYQPLVTSITRRYRLSHADAQDVSQAVWLKLFENLHRIRQPACLPGWIDVTARRQALKTLTHASRCIPVTWIESLRSKSPAILEEDLDHRLIRAEDARAIRNGLEELTPDQREFLRLTVAEPTLTYKDLAIYLNLPTGSIGPSRARHIRKLRETSAMVAYKAALAS